MRSAYASLKMFVFVTRVILGLAIMPPYTRNKILAYLISSRTSETLNMRKQDILSELMEMQRGRNN